MSILETLRNEEHPVSVTRSRVGTYIAEIEELPGCIVESDTLEEALSDIQEARYLWIKSYSLKRKIEIVPEPLNYLHYFASQIERLEKIEYGETIQLSDETVRATLVSGEHSVLVTRSRVGTYIAEIEELPGCIVESDTLEEALSDIQEARDLWIGSFAWKHRIKIVPNPLEFFESAGQMNPEQQLEEIERGETIQLSSELVSLIIEVPIGFVLESSRTPEVVSFDLTPPTEAVVDYPQLFSETHTNDDSKDFLQGKNPEHGI